MTLVRDPLTEVPLLCCWDECGQFGHHENREEVREGVKTITYIFCSERHRQYWKHSTVSNGNLPPGSRNPNGLIVR